MAHLHLVGAVTNRLQGAHPLPPQWGVLHHHHSTHLPQGEGSHLLRLCGPTEATVSALNLKCSVNVGP